MFDCRKILFITDIIDNFIGREALGIMYLSAALKTAGHATFVCNFSFESALKMIREIKPEFVAYSIATGFHKKYLELNSKLKNHEEFISIFGGPHATFYPEMIELPGIDAVCRGEGEEAIVELVGNYPEKSDIKNWWLKNATGNIIKNPMRPLNNNLDSHSLPDRKLFYDKYPAARNSKIKSFMSARGCPFACTYCFNHSFFELYKGNYEKKLRLRSVDNLLLEIYEVKSHHPLDFVHFATDTFIFDKKWLAEFSEKYKQKIGLPFFCGVRAELVTEEIAELLADAGCRSVSMGIECGNEKLRERLLKRRQSNADLIRGAENLNKFKINILSQNMIGLPDETFEQMLETLDLNRKCKVSYAEVSFFQPYPRTELGEYAVKQGLFTGNVDDISESFNKAPSVKGVSEVQLNNLHKLFAIAVEFYIIRICLKFLIKLPDNKVYKIIFKILKGYRGKFSIFPHKLTLREYLISIKRYLIDSGDYR